MRKHCEWKLMAIEIKFREGVINKNRIIKTITVHGL
jgi:hypothetical protein